MKRLRWAIASLAFGIVSLIGASSESAFGQDLLRVERLQPGQAVCVLIEDSGSYRLEKLFRAKSEMYNGVVDSNRVEQLRSILSQNPLPTLSQQGVNNQRVTDTLDTIQLAIWRNRGWQELTFGSPESRKPFRASLDPLLRWFEELAKTHPMSTRVEGTPTRCIPASSAQVIRAGSSDSSHQDNGSPEAATPVSSPNVPPHYLFRLFSSHMYAGEADTTCTIVFEDGAFHKEHSEESLQSSRRNSIAEGKLDGSSVQELKTILDSTDLKNIPGSSELGNSRFAGEATVTVLTVPRENSKQTLYFSNRFNTVSAPNEVGGRSNMNYRLTDEKLLEPLQSWSKRNTNKGGHILDKAVGNGCAPVRNMASNSDSPVK